ncbi:cupredoxin family copper-binding protein [Chloroflexota bacterium]
MSLSEEGKLIKSRLYFGIIILVVLVVVLVGCSGIQSQKPTVSSPSPLAPAPYVPSEGSPLAPTTEEPPATPLQIEVTIDGLAFNPAVLNVPIGAIVVWYNNDSVTHTVTARDNSFGSGNLSPGEPGDTFRYIFEQSGTFEYYCKIHPSMVGKIIIIE